MALPAEFHTLSLASAEPGPGDALVLVLDVPAALAGAFAFKPGQHIALRHVFDGEEVRRNYSICAGPGERLRVAIKRVEGGRFSTWAHANLKAGMQVDVMPPSGRFVLPRSEAASRRIVAFAAGSGITPVLGIIRQALAHERGTYVTLVYANRSRHATMFAEELEALKDRYLDRFELIQTFTADDVDGALLEGRITGEKVRALGEKMIEYAGAEHIFLCGPGSMIKEARAALMGLGIAAERIHHEFFAAGGGAYQKRAAPKTPAKEPVAGGREVVVILDGVRHRLAPAQGQPVLEAALAAGVKAPYACAGGMCCTCRARIVEGKAEMIQNYSLEPWELEKGFVLTCQAVPTTQRLVIDYDAM